MATPGRPRRGSVHESSPMAGSGVGGARPPPRTHQSRAHDHRRSRPRQAASHHLAPSKTRLSSSTSSAVPAMRKTPSHDAPSSSNTGASDGHASKYQPGQNRAVVHVATSSKYSVQEVWDLKVIFDRVDVNKCGTVSVMETHAALCSEGARASHLTDFAAAMFQAVDSNHNGKVTFKDILALVFEYAAPGEIDFLLEKAYPAPEVRLFAEDHSVTQQRREEVGSMFDLAVSRGHGRRRSSTGDVGFEIDEWLDIGSRHTPLTLVQLEVMFNDADRDNSGVIDKDKFIDLMTQLDGQDLEII